MMSKSGSGIFRVVQFQTFCTSPDSFFYLNPADLPSQGYEAVNGVIAIHLRIGSSFDENFYGSLGQTTSQIPKGAIGASSSVINKLGLKKDDEVMLNFVDAVSISSAYVRPKCEEDFSVLNSMQTLMESTIMNQIRIVAPKQTVSIKVGNIVVDLIFERIIPSWECGRLEKYTELIIIEKDDENSAKDLSADSTDLQYAYPSISNFLRNVFQWISGAPSLSKVLDGHPESSDSEKTLDPEELFEIAQKSSERLEYRVTPAQTDCTDLIYTNSGFNFTEKTLCSITPVPEKTEIISISTKVPKNIVGYFNISSSHAMACKDLEVYLPEALMFKMKLNIGSRVWIDQVNEIPTKTDSIVVTQDDFKNLTNICNEKTIIYKRMLLWKSASLIFEDITNIIEGNFRNRTCSNVLLTAPSGCGKSFMLQALEQDCSIKNYHCSKIDCKALRGKKIESLMKIFVSKLSECAYRQPSVLAIDDLDALMFESEENTGEELSSAAYCSRLSTIISEIAESFQSSNRLCIVATTLSVSNLTPSWSTTRGPRLFDMVLTIPELNADERASILKQFQVPVNEDIVTKTQGYRVQDLLDMASRTRLNSLVSDNDEVIVSDVEKALEDTVPISLHNVQLKKDIPYKWSDVGGMQNVKLVLDEIFRWPSQYPEIFSSCPLRLQSGALLFGPPGCGKTLIAGALANECGMNFMSVKGPELLSKYVGASEAAVRSLFERALHAQPCLLFFDELDSLAPRRGHDSTGVTDRVVNQLLTQLDGVESRSGVWVLGASSRPDLIDPALLRPGRFDRTIHCPLPNEAERLEIMQVLSRTLKFCGDVDLAVLASRAEFFTGADLQALLYSSHLKAAQLMENKAEEGAGVQITFQILEDVLEESKPSLSPAERLKFDRIFERFLCTKQEKRIIGSSEPKKVTFA